MFLGWNTWKWQQAKHELCRPAAEVKDGSRAVVTLRPFILLNRGSKLQTG